MAFDSALLCHCVQLPGLHPLHTRCADGKMTLNSLPNGLLPRSSSEPVKSEQYVVQKFGGTSVGRFATQIIEDVIKASLKSEKVAVVCSALSTTVKTEGTTNRYVRS